MANDEISEERWTAWKKKRRNTVIVYMMVGAIVGMDYTCIFTTSYTYLNDMVKVRQPKLLYGVIIAVYCGSSAVSGVAFGRWLDRSRKMRLFTMLAITLQIIGCLLYVVSDSVIFPVVGRLIAGIGDSFNSVCAGEIFRIYNRKEGNRAIWWYAACCSIGDVIGPVLVFFFNGVDFHIGSIHINVLNINGIFLAAILLASLVVSYFVVHDVSAEIDLKVYLKENDEVDEQTQVSQEIQESHETQVTQEIQETHETQKSQETQETQEKQKTRKTQKIQKMSNISKGRSADDVIENTRATTYESLDLSNRNDKHVQDLRDTSSEKSLEVSCKSSEEVLAEINESFGSSNRNVTQVPKIFNTSSENDSPNNVVYANNGMNPSSIKTEEVRKEEILNLFDSNSAKDSAVSQVAPSINNRELTNDAIENTNETRKSSFSPSNLSSEGGNQIDSPSERSNQIDSSSEGTNETNNPSPSEEVVKPLHVIIETFMRNKDIMLMFTSNFVFMYCIFSADVLLPIFITDVLKWSIRSLSIIETANAISYFIFLLVVSKYCTTDRSFYYMTIFCIATQLVLFAVFTSIEYYRVNTAIDVFLVVMYVICWVIVWCVDEVGIRCMLANMVPSHCQNFAEGTRSGISRLSTILAAITAPMVLPHLLWWVGILSIFILIILVAFVSRWKYFINIKEIEFKDNAYKKKKDNLFRRNYEYIQLSSKDTS